MKMESKLKNTYGRGLCQVVLVKFYLIQGSGDHHG